MILKFRITEDRLEAEEEREEEEEESERTALLQRQRDISNTQNPSKDGSRSESSTLLDFGKWFFRRAQLRDEA